MCPEEKNGSSWDCCLDITQSFSKNVLSLGQQTFIKCLLCDRHCVTHFKYREQGTHHLSLELEEAGM